jgi:hypothetical protein
MDIVAKLKEFIKKLNESGVPLPMIRDPQTKQPSVSLTLLVISAVNVQLSLLTKFVVMMKGMDTANSMEWFIVCCGLYFGRALSKKVQSEPPKSP